MDQRERSEPEAMRAAPEPKATLDAALYDRDAERLQAELERQGRLTAEAERDALRAGLVKAALPLEVLLATECGPEVSALTFDVKDSIREAVASVRALLAEGPPSKPVTLKVQRANDAEESAP